MLQNNNQSMQTVVETFIVEETSNLIHNSDELNLWNSRVQELGLQGQKTIVNTDKSPIPFLWMNSAIVETFATLCPTKVDISKYDKSPIPVEILDLVALSKKENYFECIEIWYNETDKDPVCVGYFYGERSRNETDYWKKAYAEKYLIGRWADVKASLDSLIIKAKNMFVINERNRLAQQIKNYQREAEDLEQTANIKFGGGMPTTIMPIDLPF